MGNGRTGKRVFEEVSKNIRDQIANGVLKAGDRLPAERDLADRFKVGRNAIREALRALENAGIIASRKGRNGGPVVRAANSSRVTHAMLDLMDFGSLEWQDLTEARALVLDLVIKLVAERASTADYDRMEHNLDLTEETLRQGQMREHVENIYGFYTHLARGTHNSVLTLLATSMTDLVRRFVETNFPPSQVTPLITLVPVRRRLVKYLREGDHVSARSELHASLQQVHVRINGWIAERRRGPTTDPSVKQTTRQLADLEAENARLLAELKTLKAEKVTSRKSAR